MDECFNPRAPCGARHSACLRRWASPEFQSTRPVRGATGAGRVEVVEAEVSIHAPRAGRDARRRRGAEGVRRVSIHAPRAGRDSTPRATRSWTSCEFQSTRPVRGATVRVQPSEVGREVSIHAPRAGRDLHALISHTFSSQFQSTRPVRGATFHGVHVRHARKVSIHAPRAGRDGCRAEHGVHGCPVSIHAPRAGRDVADDDQ